MLSRIAALVLTLAVFVTGGMSQALAADQKETPSALKKCLSEPFGKKLECIKKNARTEAFALLGIVLYLGASYDWKEQADTQFPGLREKIAGVKGAAPLIEAKMKEYIAAKEKKDPEAAEILKNLTATVDSQKRVLGNVRDIAQRSAQVAKLAGDLTVELAPVINEAANILSDPEIHTAFDMMNAGFKEMDEALYGLNSAVGDANDSMGGMNGAMGGMNGATGGLIGAVNRMVGTVNELIDAFDEMDRGLKVMNEGADEVNHGINGMIAGIDQANRGIRQMNQGIAEANRGMDQANRGVTGMNKAVDRINGSLKKPLALFGDHPFRDIDLDGAVDYLRGRASGEERVKRAVTSAVADLIPVEGDAKGVTEAITGTDVITGERLSPAERILGAVIFTRWIRAGKDVIAAEDLIKTIRAEKTAGKIDGWLSRQAWDKVPSHLKPFEKATNKGVGYRWNNGKGDGVRIDKGNPNNSQVIQQEDHVVINSGGKVIGRNGKPLDGSIKTNPEQAHIPLSEWLKWKEWNKP
ncbi:pre-toxin TG domain-containing protein [Streptomyces chrestomyceticus]|uniref:pre-toxin TG domain-containing protein n=1 Tax=Streptomyces chrestomyceticus TaxID=68185 RepID=UPI0035A93311